MLENKAHVLTLCCEHGDVKQREIRTYCRCIRWIVTFLTMKGLMVLTWSFYAVLPLKRHCALDALRPSIGLFRPGLLTSNSLR